MKNRIPGGYVLLARKLLESEIMSKPDYYLKIWMYFLLQARYQNEKGLRRGQFVTTFREVADAITVKIGAISRSRHRDDIWRACEWFRTQTMAQTTKTTRGLIVTICNYEYYQDPDNYETDSETDSETDTKQTRNRHAPDTNSDTFPLEKKERKKQHTEQAKANASAAASPPVVSTDTLVFSDEPASHHDIVALWWHLHERYRGAKPVWVGGGPGNYAKAFQALAAYQRPLRDFERAFTTGFEDQFHRNVVEPAYVAAKFNLLLNTEPRTASAGRAYGRQELTDAEIAAALSGAPT